MLEVRRRPDLGQETVGADGGGELGLEDLQRHLAVVSQIVRQVYPRCGTLAELSLDAIPVAKDLGEVIGGRRHGAKMQRLPGCREWRRSSTVVVSPRTGRTP